MAGGRTEALFSFAKQRGLNRSEAAHSLTVQLDFVSDELGIGPSGRNAGWQERDGRTRTLRRLAVPILLQRR